MLLSRWLKVGGVTLSDIYVIGGTGNAFKQVKGF